MNMVRDVEADSGVNWTEKSCSNCSSSCGGGAGGGMELGFSSLGLG